MNPWFDPTQWPPAGRAAAGILLDAGWKSVAVLAVAGVIVAALRRRSAAARHLVCFLAVAGLPVLPLLAWMLPGWRVLPAWMDLPKTVPVVVQPTSQATILPEFMSEPKEERIRVRPDMVQENQLPNAPVPPHELLSGFPIPPAPVAPAPVSAAPVPRAPLNGWSIGLYLWLAGVLVSLTPTVLGLISLYRLERAARRETAASWLELLGRWLVKLGFKRRIHLLKTERRRMPMTWGVVRPKVLLPEEAEQWPAERRSVVLLHELAHAQRGDYLTHLIARLICALYWFNPLVWLAARRMVTERERACDDIVLRHGAEPADYAEQVLEISAGLASGWLAGSAGVAMARPSNLESRLRAILDASRNRAALTRAALIAALVLLAILLVPVAMMKAALSDAESKAQPAATNSPAPWTLAVDTNQTGGLGQGVSGLGSRVSGLAGNTNSPAAWGEAVEGLSVRLTAAGPSWDFREPDFFHFSVRNQGGATYLMGRTQATGELELDGLWYHWSEPVDVKSASLLPGGHFDDLEVTISHGEWRRGEDMGWPGVGQHTLRFAVSARPQNGGPLIRVVSNPLEVECHWTARGTNVDTYVLPGPGDLNTVVRIEGRVVDDETGQAVTNFTPQMGVTQPGHPEDVHWSLNLSGRSMGGDGRFSLQGVKTGQVWRILADGYLPQLVLDQPLMETNPAPAAPDESLLDKYKFPSAHVQYKGAVMDSTPGNPLIVRLKRGGELQGVVQDDTGRPVAGARVVIHRMEGGEVYNVFPNLRGVGDNTATTDAAGRFTLRGVEATAQTVEAISADGQQSLTARQSAPGAEMTLTLPSPATLTVRFDIPGDTDTAMLNLTRSDGFTLSPVVTNHGQIGLTNLSAGTYEFRRDRPLNRGYEGIWPSDRRTVVLEAGQSLAVNLVRTNGQRLRGQVTGLDKTKASAGSLFIRPAEDTNTLTWSPVILDALTFDTNGQFQTAMLEPGNYAVLASVTEPEPTNGVMTTAIRGPDYTALTTVTITATNEPPPVILELHPTADGARSSPGSAPARPAGTNAAPKSAGAGQPLGDVAVATGGNATFTVGATGTPPISYQWTFNGTNLAGVTNSVLTLTNVTPAGAGSYSVLTLTNVPAGSASHNVVMVTNIGAATFTVGATGTQPLSYQWSFDGTNLAGATNTVLTITNVRAGSGSDNVVMVTNTGTVTFPTSATGAAPLYYQWSFNGSNLAGATNTVLTLTNMPAGADGNTSTNHLGINQVVQNPPGFITGRVVDDAGQPVAGARVLAATLQPVWLMDGKFDYGGFQGSSANTDAAGRFSLRGEGETLQRVVVVAPGNHLIWPVMESEPGRELNITLPRPGSLKVRYEIPGDAPEAKGDLTLMPTNQEDRLWTRVSLGLSFTVGNGGETVLTNLTPGTYSFRRWKSADQDHGASLERQILVVAAGQTQELDLVRTNGQRVGGTVTGPGPALASGGILFVRSAEATGIPWPQTSRNEQKELFYPNYDVTRFGADGTFQTAMLQPGSYTFVADVFSPQAPAGGYPYHPDYVGITKVTVTAGTMPPVSLTLAPSPYVNLSGNVVDDETGAPIPDVAIQSGQVNSGKPDEIAWEDGFSGMEMGAGIPAAHFTISDVKAGAAFRFVADGYVPQTLLRDEAMVSRHMANLEVRLKRGREIQGEVLDHAGRPVAGAAVYLAPVELGYVRFGWVMSSSSAAGNITNWAHTHTTTDAAGRFSLRGVDGRQTRVIAVASGGRLVQPALAAVSSTANPDYRTIILPEPATLIVRYDIPGDDELAEINLVLRTNELALPLWKDVTLKPSATATNGGQIVLNGLTPGTYDFSRTKYGNSTNGGYVVVYGDPEKPVPFNRQSIVIEPGQTREVSLVRSIGQRVHGQVTGLGDITNLSRSFLYVGPAAAGNPGHDFWTTMEPWSDGVRVETNDSFQTALLEPGTYTLAAAAYVNDPPPNQEPAADDVPQWGWGGMLWFNHRLAYWGTAQVTVTPNTAPPPVEIELRPWSAGK